MHLDRNTYDCATIGPIFWSVLATLKRTLATLSLAIDNTVGNIVLAVISGPHTSASSYKIIEIYV